MFRRWLALAGYLQALFAAHTLSSIAAIIFVEELGIPLVVPGDVAMMFAGVRVAQGRASLLSVLLVEELATIAGAGLLFLASRRLGRPLVLRFGRYIGLSRERISQAEERIRAHEMRAVILGRLIPGLRIVTVIAAGVIGVRPAKFLPGLAIGGFFYLLIYTVLGAVVGPPIIDTFTRLAIPAGALLSMAGLLIVLFTVRTMRRSEGARFAMRGAFGMAAAGGLAAFAGLLAAFAGLLSSNLVLGVMAVGGQLSDRVTDLGLAQPNGQLRFLIAWPLYLVTALMIAGLYEVLRLGQRPLLIRLALTIAVPLAATVLLVDPLGDVATASPPMAVNLVASATAAVRWIVFGIVLELLPSPSHGSRLETALGQTSP